MLYNPWLIFLHSNPVRKVLSFPYKVKAKNYLYCFNLITKVIHGHLNIQTLQNGIKIPFPQRNSSDVFAVSALPVSISRICIIPAAMTMGWTQRGKLTCLDQQEKRQGRGLCFSSKWSSVAMPLCPRAGYTSPSGSWDPTLDLDWSQEGAASLLLSLLAEIKCRRVLHA